MPRVTTRYQENPGGSAGWPGPPEVITGVLMTGPKSAFSRLGPPHARRAERATTTTLTPQRQQKIPYFVDVGLGQLSKIRDFLLTLCAPSSPAGHKSEFPFLSPFGDKKGALWLPSWFPFPGIVVCQVLYNRLLDGLLVHVYHVSQVHPVG